MNNSDQQKIIDLEAKVSRLEQEILALQNRPMELPPHFHQVDRINTKDLSGGFYLTETVPTHKEEEGKILIYTDRSATRRLYVKVDNSWYYAALT